MNKLIRELLNEYNLEMDDIRWMLSCRLTESILSNDEISKELTKGIWSGRMESELYNMEERYLSDIESQLDRELIDEAWIRENFAEASGLKCRRSTN